MPLNHPHLTCPHSHPVDPETSLEFYCPSCRNYHSLPSSFLPDIILKSHGGYLDQIMTKLTECVVKLTALIETEFDNSHKKRYHGGRLIEEDKP